MEHNFKAIELSSDNILSFDGLLPYNMANRILWPAHYGLGLVDDDRACGVMMLFFDREKSSLINYYMYIEEDYKKKLLKIPAFSNWMEQKGRLMNGTF